ncbi:MAG TPA: hypothetical protein VLV54_14785 [Thermoanaerobaculia bacterium]|nr:hypothetical protein [Thermoanaerobaculia bacterium]
MPEIYVRSQAGALRQGEIITDLVQFRLAIETLEANDQVAEYESHPFAIVLSQDCDLDQDWRARQPEAAIDKNAERRLLPSILFAQVHEAANLRGRVEGGEMWRRIKQNKDERYHFLQAITQAEDALDRGLPELGIDFKRYFAIPTDEVYQRSRKDARRRCRLVSPYLEHLSVRFCYYQFRVALPAEHESIPIA